MMKDVIKIIISLLRVWGFLRKKHCNYRNVTKINSKLRGKNLQLQAKIGTPRMLQVISVSIFLPSLSFYKPPLVYDHLHEN